MIIVCRKRDQGTRLRGKAKVVLWEKDIPSTLAFIQIQDKRVLISIDGFVYVISMWG
jgi:hypothetical protein